MESEGLRVKELEHVVIRFSGDSGDGMQLAGNIFSTISATVGNDISTFPDYPADIRAPQGSLTGVSGYQVHIGESRVYTPGDQCEAGVAHSQRGEPHYHRDWRLLTDAAQQASTRRTHEIGGERHTR